MVPIKYEPFTFHFYFYSLNSLGFYSLSIFCRSKILFFALLIIHTILLLLHLCSKKEIIGEISDEEIKFNNFKKTLYWGEIQKWSYLPPMSRSMVVTPSSFFDYSRFELETKDNKFIIEGANDFKIHKYLNKYLPRKQRGLDISTRIILNIMGLIPIVIVAFFSSR